MIKKYKLFTESVELESEYDELMKMAVETGEIKFVKFFNDKGVKLHEDSLSISIGDDDMFRFFLSKKMDVSDIASYDLRKSDIQKTLIDFGHDQHIFDTVGFNSDLRYDPKYKDTVEMYEDADKFNL